MPVRSFALALLLGSLCPSAVPAAEGTDRLLVAQAAGASAPPGLETTLGETTLDPDAQLDAERIREKTYRSQPVGEVGNWSLDVGNFATEPTPQEKEFDTAPQDSYTGLRLRLPFKGK